MGIFDRVSRLIKSNAGAAVDRLQDTAKEIDQLVLDMEAAQKRARQETVEQMAAEKVARGRADKADAERATWERRAEEAVRQGDDDLAREALLRAQELREAGAAARREAAECAATVAAQQEALRKLDARLREVKMRKGTIQAKVALGKQQGVRADALDDFERMADRIDSDESAGDAEAELADVLGDKQAATAAVEARLARLDGGGPGGGTVDDRLAALKKKMQEK